MRICLINNADILMALCKSHQKWGILIEFQRPSYKDTTVYDQEIREIEKTIPWIHELTEDDRRNLLWNGAGYFLFTTEAEMRGFYDRTVGDDGPTALNHYNGEHQTYALTCDPTGQCRNENT